VNAAGRFADRGSPADVVVAPNRFVCGEPVEVDGIAALRRFIGLDG
jgi:hypothetical protein